MKKQMLLILMTLLPMVAHAEAVEINRIYYNIDSKIKEAVSEADPNEPIVIDGLKYIIEDDWAIVVGRSEDYHDVVIPEKLTYKDKEYKVRVEQGSYNGNRRGAFCQDGGIYSYTDSYITSTDYSQGGMCYHAINLKKVSCSSLISISGGAVTATYHTAFAECSSLEEIDMPNLKRIGDIAFVGCNSLKSIDFPKLQHVEDCAFMGTNLQSINLPELIIANTMAFANCSSLNLILADKVETLGTKQHTSTGRIGGTFLNCTSLKEIVLPNIISIISSSEYKSDIVYGNLEGCNSLEKVEIGNKCEMIDKSTFKGCSALSQIYCHSITPPNLEPSAFDDNTYSSATLVVHATALKDYKSTYPWSLFKKITAFEPIYKLSYIVDGTIYKEEELAEGMIITPEAEPTKEGYTFSGWSDIPSTMPAHDVTVTGTFSINSYKLTYMVDDEVYKYSVVEYGASITPEPVPVKEGYTFSGWSEQLSVMPAHDVTVTGSFTINHHRLVYILDNQQYKSYTLDYGTIISPEANLEKEGYTFSGWSMIPETMPDNDVYVYGSFTINHYKLTYLIDGEEYCSYDVEYDASIIAEPNPTKEGHTFSGWSWIPSKMPAENVTVTGSFTVNKYIITYIVDGELLTEEEVDYGTTILPPTSQKEGYNIVWGAHPTTMPAYNITIYGSYTTGVDAITLQEDAVMYLSVDGKLHTGLQKGLNIVRMRDGTTKKVVVK